PARSGIRWARPALGSWDIWRSSYGEENRRWASPRSAAVTGKGERRSLGSRKGLEHGKNSEDRKTRGGVREDLAGEALEESGQDRRLRGHVLFQHLRRHRRRMGGDDQGQRARSEAGHGSGVGLHDHDERRKLREADERRAERSGRVHDRQA